MELYQLIHSTMHTHSNTQYNVNQMADTKSYIHLYLHIHSNTYCRRRRLVESYHLVQVHIPAVSTCTDLTTTDLSPSLPAISSTFSIKMFGQPSRKHSHLMSDFSTTRRCLVTYIHTKQTTTNTTWMIKNLNTRAH